MANLRKERPACKYGSKCYRTNEEHLLQFAHPQESRVAMPEGNNGNGAFDGSLPRSSRGSPHHQAQSSHSPEVPSDSLIVGGALSRLNVDAAEISSENGVGDARSPSNDITTADSDGIQRSSGESPAAPGTRSEALVASSGRKPEAGSLLLVLVGLPGSGKSTFCANLLVSSLQPWTRVCQDVLKSRKSCLKHSKRALEESRSVLVDRCNFDKDQRSEFLQLAASLGVEAHAVVLDLPHSLCVERASKRIGHEGKVEGDGARKVVAMVSRGRQFPSLAEGFHRITFCRTDTDIEKVLQQYRELERSQRLGSGVFGDVGIASKGNAQVGSSESRLITHNLNDTSNDPMRNMDKKLRYRGENPKQGFLNGKRFEQEHSKVSTNTEGGTDDRSHSTQIAEGGGVNILAFPSISTADFQFDHESASNVLVEAVSDFFLAAENSRLRLMLTDLTDSTMLSKVRRKASERGLDSQRFFTYVGDITKLRSSGRPGCSVIANAANWRLKAGGGGVNAAIYKAAGADLERATKEVAQTLQPGESIVVGLPESSPLYKGEGVTHVIHVLGPNMNPQRPNCLFGDYNTGCRILRNVYTSLFKNFSALGLKNVVGVTRKPDAHSATTNQNPKEASFAVDIAKAANPPRKNAFTVLMQASKRTLDSKSSNTKPEKIRVTEELASRTSKPKDTHGTSDHRVTSCTEMRNTGTENAESGLRVTDTGSDAAAAGRSGQASASQKETLEPTHRAHQEIVSQGRKKWQTWTLALFNMAMHPEQHMDVVLQTTDDAVVVRDAYPKAKQHVLVLARKFGLDGIEDLRLEHVPILKRMHAIGEEWAASLLKSDPSLVFRLGYHSVPSMRQVHLHVISQDFDSPSLKNKKHWNSFTSSFFLDSLDIIRQLEEKGLVQVAVGAEGLLEMELRCHRCRSVHPNLPRLKQHISRCSQPFANKPYLISSCENSVDQTM